jgi:hypothetical protein
LSTGESYQQSRGLIVLVGGRHTDYKKVTGANIHASTGDKTDDLKDSFCEELKYVFDTFPKYPMKILFGDSKEDVSKQELGIRLYMKLVMIMD